MFFGSPGWMEMLLMMAFTMRGVPLGLPPAAEDPLMSKVAPEECIFYLSWAGMAEPDPNSKNHTEQLLAEKEVQRFVKHLDKTITAYLIEETRNDDELERIMASEMPKLVKAVVTNPGAVFVEKVGFGPRGVEARGGAVINTGEQTAELKKVLDKMESALAGQIIEVEQAGQKWKEFPAPEGFPRMLWGFKGNYMIVGFGKDAVDGILTRVRTNPPAWLTELRTKVPVQRVSTIMYLDVRKALELSLALSPDPEAKVVTSVLGFDNVKYVGCVSGLDETDYVSRTLLATDGTPTGLFSVPAGRPLTLADLKPIPKDATYSAAARLDAEKLYRDFRDAIGRISPPAQQEFDREMERAEAELGIKLSDDIFKPLGDSWRMYNAPSEGGLLMTGLTGVVSVRDRDRFAKTLEKIQKIAQAQAQQAANPGGRVRRHVTIGDIEFENQKIYFMNFIGEWSPFAPAWCLTEKEFIISLYPSHVKSYLSRGEDFQSIVNVPQVARHFNSTSGPTLICTEDSRQLFEYAYPFVQIVAQLICSEAQREGLKLDITMMPSATSISRHLHPGVITVRRTDDGIEMTSRQSAPIGVGALPLALPMMFFGLAVSSPPRLEAAPAVEAVPAPRRAVERAVPERPPQPAPRDPQRRRRPVPVESR